MADNDNFTFIDPNDGDFEEIQVTECLGDGTKTSGDWMSLGRKLEGEKEKASDPVDDETVAARTGSSFNCNELTLPLYPSPVLKSDEFRKWLLLQDEFSSKSAYDCITQKRRGHTEWLKRSVIADNVILNALRSNVRNKFRHEQTSTTALARSVLNSFAKELAPYVGDRTTFMRWQAQDKSDTFVDLPEFENVEDMFLKVYQTTFGEPTDPDELL